VMILIVLTGFVICNLQGNFEPIAESLLSTRNRLRQMQPGT
jgi:hypothetical protein